MVNGYQIDSSEQRISVTAESLVAQYYPGCHTVALPYLRNVLDVDCQVSVFGHVGSLAQPSHRDLLVVLVYPFPGSILPILSQCYTVSPSCY